MVKITPILVSLFVLAGSVPASAQSLTLNRVKSLLTELGLKPVMSTDEMVTLEARGRHKVDIDITLVNDKTGISIYSSWKIPPDKAAAIPLVAMLKANNNAQFAFAIYGEDGNLSFDLEKNFDAALVSKAMLSKSVEELLATVDRQEPLWNMDNWTAAPGGR